MQESQEDVENVLPNRQCDMMGRLRVKPHRNRKHSFEWQLDAAARLARTELRSHTTLPPSLEDVANIDECIDQCEQLPPVSCAFKGCTWLCDWSEAISNDAVNASESAYDRQLRDHVLNIHRHQIKHALESHGADLWDVYKQAIAVKEREKVPTVGPAIDRRSVNHTRVAYNDERQV